MLLGVTNKKQVLIDLGIDDIWEADDAADDNIAGGKTQGPQHLRDISDTMALSRVKSCHNIIPRQILSNKYRVWGTIRLRTN